MGIKSVGTVDVRALSLSVSFRLRHCASPCLSLCHSPSLSLASCVRVVTRAMAKVANESKLQVTVATLHVPMTSARVMSLRPRHMCLESAVAANDVLGGRAGRLEEPVGACAWSWVVCAYVCVCVDVRLWRFVVSEITFTRVCVCVCVPWSRVPSPH